MSITFYDAVIVGERYIRTDPGKMTTVAGVYAAGDVAQIMQNATFASADGVLAGSSLHRSFILEPL